MVEHVLLPQTRFRRAAVLVAAVVAVLIPTVAVGPALTVPVTPRDLPLPVEVDLQQQYQGQSICDPVAKPGIVKLTELLKTTYGKNTMYSTRACADDPSSEHTEGRALDWMVSKRVPAQKEKALAFLNWLTAPGPDGTPAAMARRMGIMYIGWDDQIWRGYGNIGWGELKGCFSKQSTSYDTYCHRDHVHFSLTWDGAAANTSYWDGGAQLTPPCTVSRTSGKVPAVSGPLRDVALPAPKRVINTNSGAGNSKRICRLQEDRWAGDLQKIDVKIAGKAGVPAQGVKSALLRVYAVKPNSPMPVWVWPTNGKRPAKPKLTATLNKTSSATFRVKLGAKGAVSVATSTGDAAIRVDVVSYRTNS